MLMTTPHYSPVITHRARLLPWESNNVIREDYVSHLEPYQFDDKLEPHLWLGEFFASEKGQALLQDMIDRFHVDIIVSGAFDSWKVRKALDEGSPLTRRLRILFDRDNYLVMAVAARGSETPSRGD
jgi:hypothetical protein